MTLFANLAGRLRLATGLDKTGALLDLLPSRRGALDGLDVHFCAEDEPILLVVQLLWCPRHELLAK